MYLLDHQLQVNRQYQMARLVQQGLKILKYTCNFSKIRYGYCYLPGSPFDPDGPDNPSNPASPENNYKIMTLYTNTRL